MLLNVLTKSFTIVPPFLNFGSVPTFSYHHCIVNKGTGRTDGKSANKEQIRGFSRLKNLNYIKMLRNRDLESLGNNWAEYFTAHHEISQ